MQLHKKLTKFTTFALQWKHQGAVAAEKLKMTTLYVLVKVWTQCYV